MMMTRRTFLKHLCHAVAVALLPRQLWAAWSSTWFAPQAFTAAWQQIVGEARVTDSDAIHLTLPLIAENGAVVPLSVTTTLPDVTALWLFVANNPVPLAACLRLTPQMAGEFSARLKMAESSDVIVLVQAAGQFYRAKQWVKVTVGGCGG